MSQQGLVDIEGSHPQIPTEFITDSGTAVPINNQLEVLGGNGITTSGSGNTVTISLDGGSVIESINVQAGTSPVTPDAGGAITLNGAVVAAGSTPIQSNGTGAHTLAIQVQRAQTSPTSNANLAGMASFDSTDFTVDANGFVALSGAGAGQTITGQSGGALLPTAGNWNIFGASTAAGTSPVATSGSGSTLTVNVQKAQALAATDATKVGLCNFKNTNFTVDANGFVSLSGTGAGQTITGDSGGALSPTAGNWNILGQQAGSIAVMDTIGSGSTLSVENRAWLTSLVVDASTTNGTRGTFSTIASALTAASSGQTIFIRPGTYTENLTLKAGVDLCAFDCDAETPNVTIVGKCTMTTAGTVTMSGIRLQTNSDFFLAVTGSAASVVKLKNCYLNCANNTGISHTSSDAGSAIWLIRCEGTFGTTGIAMWAKTSAGNMLVENCNLFFGSATSTASTNSAAQVIINHSRLNFPLSCSSTGVYSISFTEIATDNQNATALTTAGTGTSSLKFCALASGTASALSIGANTTVTAEKCKIASTNTNAATGAGTLQFGDLEFSSSSVMNVTTQSGFYTDLGQYKATQQPMFCAFLPSGLTDQTGDGTNVSLGAVTTALTELYDIGGNFNPGDGAGAAATFTAPVTGKYMLIMSVLYQQVTSSHQPQITILTTARNYTNGNYGSGATGNQPLFFSVIADMTATDTATFRCTVSGSTKTVDIYGATSSDMRTFVQGYLIA
jgi:hypothetical protein